MTLSHFVIQTKHGIIVEVSTVSSIRKNKAAKSNKKGLNPWYERNLEIIMMNMQNMMKQLSEVEQLRLQVDLLKKYQSLVRESTK